MFLVLGLGTLGTGAIALGGVALGGVATLVEQKQKLKVDMETLQNRVNCK